MSSETHPSQDFPPEDLHRDLIRVPLLNGDTILYDIPPNEHDSSKDNGPFKMTLQSVTLNLIKVLHGEADREYTLSELSNLIEAKTGESIADRTTRVALEELDIINHALGVRILTARGSSPRLYSWASKAIFVAEAKAEASTPEAASPPAEVLLPTKNNEPLVIPNPPSNPKPPQKPIPGPPRRASPKAEQKLHPHTKIEQQQTAFLDGLHELSQTSGVGPVYRYLKKSQELVPDDADKQKIILLDAFNNIHNNLSYLLPGTPQSKTKERLKRRILFAQALRFLGENYEKESETLTSRLQKTDFFAPDQLTTIANRALADMAVEVSHEPLKRNPHIVLPRAFLKQAAIILFHMATGPGLSMPTHHKFTEVQRVSADLGLGIGHGENFIKPITQHLDLRYRCVALMKELCDQLTIRNAVAKIDPNQTEMTEAVTQVG